MIIAKKMGALLLLLCILVSIYTIGLIGAYSFPDRLIKENVSAAVAILQEEGNMIGGYGTYFWHNGYGITDNLTDIGIYTGLLRGDNRSTLDAAMRTDYVRYWHGYAVILRPLMIVFSIINIRYLNMMLMFGLFMAGCWQCSRELDNWTAFAFGGGLLTSFILIAPFCQQYCPVYMITLISCYGLLRLWKNIQNRLNEVFLVIGSLVCFFDFLTFPVLALGYPLLVCLLMRKKEGATSAQMWTELFVLSAIWMTGYAMTWLSKALIGSILTDADAWTAVLKQVVFRMTGDYAENREVTAWIAIRQNLETYFMGSTVAFWVLCVVTYGVRILIKKTPMAEWLVALPIVVIAAYPFIWYCVLQNHTRMHFWMTYRMLAISFFALIAYLAAIGNSEKAKK